MVQAGAKGSTVNCMQISCLLGQIELEGRRPPIMLSGRSLPTFLPYDTTPRSGGFVDGRFLTGVRPPEFFLHAMAGREGLVDTAVKTSRSGYLQRCLVKHLEGITVNYDLTVRDSDGSVLQFLYGEDGLDISKTRFLSSNQMYFLEDNYKAFLYRLDPTSAVSVLETTKAAKYQRKVDKWKKKQKQRLATPRIRRSGFLDYCDQHLPEILAKYSDNSHSTRAQAHRSVIDLWYSSSPMLRKEFNDKHDTVYYPTTSVLRPDRYFGSVPEKLTSDIEQYISTSPTFKNNGNQQTLLTPEKFRTLSQFKCLRAVAEPGEPVGLLAAQSIGEPSTQMTLNTFHFAGRGEMNVTLGIPRLREILMTGSPNIKTPAMDVPLLPLPDAKEQGENIKKYFSRVLLKDVLDSVEVWESLDRKGEGFYHRSYVIKLTFLDPKYYKDEYIVTPSKILEFVETCFINKLTAVISKEIKKSKDKLLKTPGTYVDKDSIPQQSSGDDDKDIDNEGMGHDSDDDSDESDVEEAEKAIKNKKQQVSYEAADDEDIEAIEGEEEEGKEEEENEKDTRKDNNEESIQLDMEAESMYEPLPSQKSTSMDSSRIEAVVSKNSHLSEYIYDAENERWCQFTLKFETGNDKIMMSYFIEKLSNKVVVWEVPDIKKGFLAESQVPGEEGLYRLKTEGVNMQELWKHSDLLNVRKAYTNNIHIIASTFGIEAAAVAIIKEVSSVFNVYGISVNHRHLSLIADYMTFDGDYKSFSRFGMNSNSSPFQQMSFETTMKFLRSATVRGDVDTLRSPSACLVTGNVVHGGTGAFQCLQKLVI
ncbi:PREDICTED: DNA-directed RNA polymerase I subunit RPA1 isoform X2 [Amphimedon queenslandica]|nr:PREDICTED: DNA-directed RNA polymerase I subunit RPA1 isoform X2 [Amphimedon queenslandica]|eukprot:XP_019852827.1 PREDICTED: DNA-directed RNA polymerase I subunit RPA1 isoform X2 [Amphimedon queenslandica]